MTNHPNRGLKDIFVANHGGRFIEVVIAAAGVARCYTMNSYATFHELDHERQVMGSANSCYRGTQQETAAALRKRYGRSRVTFVAGRFYTHRDDNGFIDGYHCDDVVVHGDGTIASR